MAGIWDFVGKIGDWLLPNKAEYRRNKIEELKREQEDLLKKPCTPESARRVDVIAEQLRKLNQEAANA